MSISNNPPDPSDPPAFSGENVPPYLSHPRAKPVQNALQSPCGPMSHENLPDLNEDSELPHPLAALGFSHPFNRQDKANKQETVVIAILTDQKNDEHNDAFSMLTPTRKITSPNLLSQEQSIDATLPSIPDENVELRKRTVSSFIKIDNKITKTLEFDLPIYLHESILNDIKIISADEDWRFHKILMQVARKLDHNKLNTGEIKSASCNLPVEEDQKINGYQFFILLKNPESENKSLFVAKEISILEIIQRV
jgi:hypothetical protein